MAKPPSNPPSSADSASRAFTRTRKFDYLTESDRYLSAAAAPQFKFGFIGCGVMGQEHMLNTVLEGRANVAALYDPAGHSVEHALSELRRVAPDAAPTCYSSLDDICHDEQLDALIICTPNHTHIDVMRRAVQSDKALLLEKPVATNVADAYEVCQLAARHPKVVRIGLQYRYKAIYRAAIEQVLDQTAVGRVQRVEMLEHRFPFLDKVGQWNKFNQFTGGTLVEKCCHYFDLLNLFSGGRPQQVFASGSQAVNFKQFTYDNRRADGLDHASVIINYDNGVVGQFSLCMFVPGSREELVICGDQGRLHAFESAQLGEPNQNHLSLWRGEHSTSFDSNPSYPSYIANAGHHGSTFYEHVAFVDDLLRGSYDGPSAANAFWSVMVGAAAQASIEAGEAIEVASLLPSDYDEQTLITTSSTT